MPKYASMFERLVANSEIPEGQNENGCWLWTGKLDRRGEYGHLNMWVEGKHKTVKAHRVMFAVINGVDLAPDETVEHLCYDSPNCINPDHFHDTPISRSENSQRSQRSNPRLPRRNVL